MHDGHDHDHSHSHSQADGGLTAVKAMLSYMLEHNRHHAEELRDMAHKLEHQDKDEAARTLIEGAEFFDGGNDKLKKVLEMLK